LKGEEMFILIAHIGAKGPKYAELKEEGEKSSGSEEKVTPS